MKQTPKAKIYVVMLRAHPELGVQAAFTTRGAAQEFANDSAPLGCWIDEIPVHHPRCCTPVPLSAQPAAV